MVGAIGCGGRAGVANVAALLAVGSSRTAHTTFSVPNRSSSRTFGNTRLPVEVGQLGWTVATVCACVEHLVSHTSDASWGFGVPETWTVACYAQVVSVYIGFICWTRARSYCQIVVEWHGALHAAQFCWIPSPRSRARYAFIERVEQCADGTDALFSGCIVNLSGVAPPAGFSVIVPKIGGTANACVGCADERGVVRAAAKISGVGGGCCGNLSEDESGRTYQALACCFIVDIGSAIAAFAGDWVPGVGRVAGNADSGNGEVWGGGGTDASESAGL